MYFNRKSHNGRTFVNDTNISYKLHSTQSTSGCQLTDFVQTQQNVSYTKRSDFIETHNPQPLRLQATQSIDQYQLTGPIQNQQNVCYGALPPKFLGTYQIDTNTGGDYEIPAAVSQKTGMTVTLSDVPGLSPVIPVNLEDHSQQTHSHAQETIPDTNYFELHPPQQSRNTNTHSNNILDPKPEPTYFEVQPPQSLATSGHTQTISCPKPEPIYFQLQPPTGPTVNADSVTPDLKPEPAYSEVEKRKDSTKVGSGRPVYSEPDHSQKQEKNDTIQVVVDGSEYSELDKDKEFKP